MELLQTLPWYCLVSSGSETAGYGVMVRLGAKCCGQTPCGERRRNSYTRGLVKYCTVIIATVPILVIYPFVQKHFFKGAMIGAVKG